MPKYVITSPDGKKYEITAPDGASQDDVLNFVMSQHQPEPEKQKLEEPSFLVGVGKGMNDVARGLGDLVGHPNWTGIEPDKRADKEINDKAPIGQMVGNMAATAPTMLIPGANTLAGGALIGAGTSALTTEGNAEKRLESGAMGGIAGGVGSLIPYAANLVAKTFAPFGSTKQKEAIVGRMINKITEKNAPDIIARLESAKPLVEGTKPTAAEVANSGGIAAMQRFVASANPENYAYRDVENKAARYAALQGIAGDEEKMQAALKARSDAVEPLYQSASRKVVQSDAQLKDILDRLPNGTMQTAKDISRMNKQPFQFGKDVPAHQIDTGMLDQFGRPIMRDIPAQYSSISGQGIDLLKKAIDDTVNTNPTASIGKNAKNAGLGVKEDLLNWADAKIPEYAQARELFQEHSRPINQMQVGQELLNKLGGSLTQHGASASEMANRYATALNDVKGNLVKNATGGIKRDLKDVMTPEQMDVLNGVAQDLARVKNSNDLGRGAGSNTAQNFAMNGIAEAAGIPTMLSGLLQALPPTRAAMGVGKSVASKIYDAPEREMRGLLADAMLDPKETARLMKMAQKKGLLEGKGKYSGLLGIGAADTYSQQERD